MGQKIKTQNVSLYRRDLDVVEALQKQRDLESFSAALRTIIREWRRQTQLRLLAAAYQAELITASEAVERLVALAEG